jgi:RNA polymerase sigma-70 factor (ECF subfamily)
MARMRAGDPTALAEVYDQYAGYVFAIARRVTLDASLAEDVTQEVFCQLWERPAMFEPDRGTLRSFIATLAHRRAVDCVRRQEATRRRDVKDLHHPPDQPDIAEEVGAFLLADDVRAAVETLPEEQRTPVLLAYFRGYTYRELATILGIAEGTAKSRIRLALAKLRRALSEGRAIA